MQSSHEIDALERAIKKLESDLVSARQAESILETQKQENLQLKETIDRMRYELDEARSASAANTAHTRGSTVSSVPGTLSRNLGDELNRRLADMESVNESQEEEGGDGDGEGEGDSYVETVVTTQRTRVGL